MIYKIKKGKHGSGKIPAPFLFRKEWNWKVKFDSSAIYTSAIPVNQWDVNKLIGVVEGIDVHKNSARFAWNFFEGMVRLHAYAYVNGERKQTEICTAPIDQWINLTLRIEKDFYLFIVEDVHTPLERGPKSNRAVFGWTLHPYFGGDEVAPHDIKIEIK